MSIKNEILQNLEAKSEENVEQKPTKWKEFKTKHRTTAKIIKVTKGFAVGGATGAGIGAITFGIDASKKFDEKQREAEKQAEQLRKIERDQARLKAEREERQKQKEEREERKWPVYN
ncbi:MAG: hypothetical protein PPFGHCPK_00961 [Spiroplasma endosymbiont of Drosophila atripex]|nr:MAG: hypothetical protein PPFGHCPK_00961 [Spiroplasma endosymbiont of Drosophila atripex]